MGPWWKKFLRRRRFIVNPRLQLQLLLGSFAEVSLTLVALSAALFVPLMLRVQQTGSQVALQALETLLYMHETFWPTAGIILVAIVLHSIYVSHRVAGPLYRFRAVYEQIGAGKTPADIRLRKGDLLIEEMQAINRMLARLREREASSRGAESTMSDLVDECVRLAEKTDCTELQDRLAKMAER